MIASLANKKENYQLLTEPLYETAKTEEISIYTLLVNFIQEAQKNSKTIVFLLEGNSQIRKLKELLTQKSINFQEINHFHDIKSCDV